MSCFYSGENFALFNDKITFLRLLEPRPESHFRCDYDKQRVARCRQRREGLGAINSLLCAQGERKYHKPSARPAIIIAVFDVA
jgi:hypothetical protein